MVKSSEHNWRYWLALGCVAAMFTGLFFSRALLSVAVILFAANGILNPQVKQYFAAWRKDKMAIGQLLLFLVPLLSFFWSADKDEWATRTLVKLPLLVLPFGFFVLQRAHQQHIQGLSNLFIAFMAGGSAWSISRYLQQPALYHELYLRAKVLPTPFDTNHIYFSFTIVVAVLLCMKLMSAENNRIMKLVYSIAVIWFIIYLHILSAKTGLLCLYISLFVSGIYYLWNSKSKWLAALLLFICIASPLVAYRISTTFKNRIDYLLYDFDNYSKGNFLEGLSDGNRYRSVLAGKDIFLEHPIIGVGFGDVMKTSHHWYNEFFPRMQEYEKMLPSSEVLLYACGAGSIGLLGFLFAVFLPFARIATQKDIGLWILQLILIVFLLYEVSLEGQFGVFIYGFFTWWWMIPSVNQQQYE